LGEERAWVGGGAEGEHSRKEGAPGIFPACEEKPYFVRNLFGVWTYWVPLLFDK